MKQGINRPSLVMNARIASSLCRSSVNAGKPDNGEEMCKPRALPIIGRLAMLERLARGFVILALLARQSVASKERWHDILEKLCALCLRDCNKTIVPRMKKFLQFHDLAAFHKIRIDRHAEARTI